MQAGDDRLVEVTTFRSATRSARRGARRTDRLGAATDHVLGDLTRWAVVYQREQDSAVQPDESGDGLRWEIEAEGGMIADGESRGSAQQIGVPAVLRAACPVLSSGHGTCTYRHLLVRS
jgi:hypothetical protein